MRRSTNGGGENSPMLEGEDDFMSCFCRIIKLKTEERKLKSNRSFTFDELMTGNRSEEFIESAYPFMKLMMQYQCAMLEVRTSLRY